MGKNIQHFKDGKNRFTFFIETRESNNNPQKRDSLVELLLNIFLGIERKYKDPSEVNKAQIAALFKDFEKTEIM